MNGSWLLVALLLIVFTLGGVGMGIVMSSRVEDMESFFQLNMLITMPCHVCYRCIFSLEFGSELDAVYSLLLAFDLCD